MKLFKKLLSWKRSGRSGFSLVEMMTAVAVFSLVMVLVFQILERTTVTWKHSKDSVSEFKDARNAFEAITKRLSQATLNTYWKVPPAVGLTGATKVADQLSRMSELHYVSGPAEDIMGQEGAPTGAGQRVGHCVFFQSPTGITYAQEKGKYRYGTFPSLLNSWGYFVEFNTDQADRPNFLNNLKNPPGVRARFRLMEYLQPAESNLIYHSGSEISQFLETSPQGKLSKEKTYEWFKNATNVGINFPGNYPSGASDKVDVRNLRVIADNILALILLPTNSVDPNRIGRVAPNYMYDTRAWLNNSVANSGLQKDSRNMLQPIVQVVMIALDESAIKRLNASLNIRSVQDFSRYKFWAKFKTLFKNAQLLEKDLAELRQELATPDGNPKLPITFRVFRSTVRIRESRWSGNDPNNSQVN